MEEVRVHLTDPQLEGYARRTLSAAELLAADGHLAECSACQARLQEPEALTRLVSGLAGHLEEATRSPRHLKYEELAGYVDDDLHGADREVAEAHLQDCASCAGEVLDLAAFRRTLAGETRTPSVRGVGPWRRAAVWVPLAAAASLAAWLTVVAVRTPAIPPRTATGSPPAPAPTAPSSPALVASLRDGGREVTLDAEGRLQGLPAVSPDCETTVRVALTRAEVKVPRRVADLAGSTGTLLGSAEEGIPFALVSPVATAVESTRPTFRWQPLPGADRYEVSVFDAEYRQVAMSPPIRALEWISDRPLARGRVYAWQVSAEREGREVVSPTAPAPEARFEVLGASRVEELRRARSDAAGSHLLLGLISAEAGLLEDAERELQALMAENPGAELPRRLLDALHRHGR
jgi:anti-sigma factor RsiW